MKKEYPNHKFILGKDEFNSLICGLVENYNTFNKYDNTSASHIVDTVKRYARFYEENGKEFVQVNFYDKEADMLIWEFVLYVFATHEAKIETDYYAQIQTDMMEDLKND
ncbi:MAG: hypothetical protein SNH27_15390 [Rikenellaceae bacterium]